MHHAKMIVLVIDGLPKPVQEGSFLFTGLSPRAPSLLFSLACGEYTLQEAFSGLSSSHGFNQLNVSQRLPHSHGLI
jgi:hypothetical protein